VYQHIVPKYFWFFFREVFNVYVRARAFLFLVFYARTPFRFGQNDLYTRYVPISKYTLYFDSLGSFLARRNSNK